MAKIRIKGYKRKDGIEVRGHLTPDKGMRGHGKKVVTIEHPGRLGGPGFFDKSKKEQKRLVFADARKHGERSTLGSLQALGLFNKSNNDRKMRIDTLREDLVEKKRSYLR